MVVSHECAQCANPMLKGIHTCDGGRSLDLEAVTAAARKAERRAAYIDGEFVTIEGTPTMREDMVRIAMGTADIRYRGEFKEWRTTFVIRYNANVLSLEQIVNLFNTGGFGIGVGEWRPQKDGSFGMFHIATSEE